MIEVLDDFFSQEIHEKIWQLVKRPKWSLTGGNPSDRFWHMNDLEGERYFNTYLFKIICKKLNRSFKIRRVYANGQTAGQCGVPHRDDGDVTVLYYPNPEWKLDWQGHFMVLEGEDSSSEIARTITYKPNRAIILPANIYHYADAPHRMFNGLRISVAWKLLKK